MYMSHDLHRALTPNTPFSMYFFSTLNLDIFLTVIIVMFSCAKTTIDSYLAGPVQKH